MNERDISKEEVRKFLIEMIKQDNRLTAFPYYYVIREDLPVARYDLWQSNHDDFGTEMEADERAFIRFADERGLTMIKESGMFLTEKDAENHLRTNPHHYGKTARSYVKHCWRAPHTTDFFKNLFNMFGIDCDMCGSFPYEKAKYLESIEQQDSL